MAESNASAKRSRIFISYRRGDTEHPVGRLAEDLRKHFAHDQVFQDIASIDPGADFVEAVQQGLDTCAAVLVVIGPSWLTIADRQGRRRLELPDDWVKHEVAESLRRPGVRVFPVLLGADMPSAEELPEALRPLTRRQAFPLTARHWTNDVAQLVEFLRKVPGLAQTLAPKAKTPQEEPAAGSAELRPGTVFRDGDDCPEMVVIPEGEFVMGSPTSEAGRDTDEGPQHKVTLARPFAVGKYEVTFDEWDACVRAGGCAHKPHDWDFGRGRQPVIEVSWEDAQAFVAWLSKKTGKPYRLLSEAEWEYAARARTTTRYPWGDAPETNRAKFARSVIHWAGAEPSQVGRFDANPFGLHDMIGNVIEWVQDCWNDSYQGAPADGRAWESGECRLRVVRGGSFLSLPSGARAANRSKLRLGSRVNDTGFRVARTL